MRTIRFGLVGFVVGMSFAAGVQGAGTDQAPPPPPSPIIQVPATAAAAAARPTGTGLVLGQVVDAGTGRPVSSAVVSLLFRGVSRESARTNELADVGLLPPTAEAGVTGPPTRIMADAEGRFVFRDLASGQYSFSATAPGYLSGSYGQRRPGGPSTNLELTDGEKLRGATFRLWKTGALTGTVLDEGGEPAAGTMVRAFRRSIVGGRRRWAPGLQATTDDRGVYRIANLTPGDYTVAAMFTASTIPRSTVEAYRQAIMAGPSTASSQLLREFSSSGAPFPDAGGFQVGDYFLAGNPLGSRSLLPPAPAADGKVLAYQTVYYPAATSLSAAAVITLGSGDERSGIDLQLRLVPTARVSGTVSGPDGPVKTIGVRLIPPGADELASDSGFEIASTATDASGAFTFLGVPSGQYTLLVLRVPRPEIVSSGASEAVMIGAAGGGVVFGTATPSLTPPPPPPVPTEPTLWGAVPVVVSETDVSGLAVTLRPGARVTGRVEFNGTKAKPTPEQIQRISVTLSPLDTRPATLVATGRVSPDNQFATQGYPPGKYLVSASLAGPDWTFKAALHGGRDVSDEPLEITGPDIGGVVLVYTDRTTELSGTVTGARGQPDTEADIIIFPADRGSPRDAAFSPRRIRSARTSRTGAYQIAGLPQGDYYVAAVSTATGGDWQDADFLDSVRKVATRVTLSDGEKRILDLKTSAVK